MKKPFSFTINTPILLTGAILSIIAIWRVLKQGYYGELSPTTVDNAIAFLWLSCVYAAYSMGEWDNKSALTTNCKSNANYHDIYANVLLVRKDSEDHLCGIVQTLPSGIRNNIWMHFNLKANLQPTDEISIGFDIRKLNHENSVIELGYCVFTPPKNIDKNKSKAERKFGVRRLKDSFIIGQSFDFPVLEKGYYEFIVYEKTQSNQNFVLDTYTFEVSE